MEQGVRFAKGCVGYLGHCAGGRISVSLHRTMAQQGATLQNYNNELVKCIEDLREKREEVNRAMLKEEEEKAKIQKVSCTLKLVLNSSSRD